MEKGGTWEKGSWRRVGHEKRAHGEGWDMKKELMRRVGHENNFMASMLSSEEQSTCQKPDGFAHWIFGMFLAIEPKPKRRSKKTFMICDIFCFLYIIFTILCFFTCRYQQLGNLRHQFSLATPRVSKGTLNTSGFKNAFCGDACIAWTVHCRKGIPNHNFKLETMRWNPCKQSLVIACISLWWKELFLSSFLVVWACSRRPFFAAFESYNGVFDHCFRRDKPKEETRHQYMCLNCESFITAKVFWDKNQTLKF